jgi:hypothetical protein
MFHTRVKAATRIGPHNHDVISVIVGSLLGDCNASKRSVEGTRFVYKQSIEHKDYHQPTGGLQQKRTKYK